MKIQSNIIVCSLIILLAGCNQAGNYELQKSAATEEEAPVATMALETEINANQRKSENVIRTADLKFKVNDVTQSTYNIEKIAEKLDGFVTQSNLNSTIDYVNSTAVSNDSTLETTYYTVSNSIIIRVPVQKLDTALKLISANIVFLNYRNIKADDVSLMLLTDELTRKRAARADKRVIDAIDKKGKKLTDVVDSEMALLGRQEQADNAYINSLSLKNKIQYSTISIDIYQRQSIRRELIANNKNIEEYQPGFGSKLLESLSIGWEIMQNIVLVLARLWVLFLLGLIAFLAYSTYFKKKQ